MGPGGRPGNFDFGSFADVFDDLFGDFMGGAAGGAGRRAAAPICATISRSRSRRRSAASRPRSGCRPRCAARPATRPAAARGGPPGVCPSCRGAGRVRAQQGFFTIERTCPTCAGTGRVITDPCEACSGSGRVHREKTLSVTIPQGVEDGTRIRLTGEGEAGTRGGATGDLYIFVSVTPHRMFRRDGSSLLLPGADPGDHGGARRPDRGADHRRPARAPADPRRAPRPAIASACAARA